MTTLTGKLSQLSDIAQQSAGTLMSGVTEQLKVLVESLTKSLQSAGMQEYVKSLAEDLRNIVVIFGDLLGIVIKLLPLITNIVKLLLVIKAINIAGSLIKGVTEGLFSAATMLSSFSIGMSAVPALFANAGAAVSLFGEALTGVFTMLAANPIALVLMGLTAVAVGGTLIANKAIENERKQYNNDASMRESRLAQELARSGSAQSSGWLDPKLVSNIAKEYKLAEEVVARIAVEQGAITKSQYEQYVLQQKNTADAKAYAQAMSEASKYKMATMGESQVSFLSELTGKDSARYMGDAAAALGTRGANDYIASFAEQMDKDRKTYGDAFSPDIEKQNWEKEAKALSEALVAGFDVPGLFANTGFDETIQKRLIQLNKLLDTTKGKAAKELGKWWAPIVQAAKVSIDPIDDITVATQQASEAAAKEFNDRQKNYDELIKQAKTEQDAIRYMQMKSSEAALYLQYQKDITAEGEKQKNLKLYETATEGNSAVMDQWKASAGAAYAQGGIAGTATGAAIQGTSQMLSGTQMGAMATGGNPVAVAMTAFVDFAKSIENVNAVLNPFTTIFEAMRDTLEPIVNNVLQPLVDHLQMVGEAIAPIISVLVASLKPAIVMIYLVTAPLTAALQILAAGFTWFYNSIIVTVANWIINIANAIIHVLNKIPGVHIRYIDQLQKMGAAVVDLTATINNQKSALDKTITYLTDKINNAIDDQLSSLKDLYEVGAISATSYDAQVTALNAQKISTDSAAVSSADMALTGQAIYERLYALYDLKDTIENGNLDNEQIASLLKEYSISSQTEESKIKNAVLAALQAYNASTGTTSNVSTAASDKVLTSLNNSASLLTSLAASIAAVQATKDKLNHMMYDQGADLSDLWTTYATWIKQSGTLQSSQEQYAAVLAAYKETLQTAANMGLDVSGYQSYAVGTGNVPYDMTAQIHKGEGIVPSTFMDSIRSGELALSSGKNEGSGQNVIVNVTVQGSVQTEKDLAASIATSIYQQRGRNLLTV
jgi:hypothetical protein